MTKFANVSCSICHQELDLFCYNVECDQLTKWAESDSDQKDQRIKEVTRVLTTGCSYNLTVSVYYDNSFLLSTKFCLKVQNVS